MTIFASRIVQTLALVLLAPFAWAFGLFTFSLVSLGHTFQAIRKVWAK